MGATMLVGIIALVWACSPLMAMYGSNYGFNGGRSASSFLTSSYSTTSYSTSSYSAPTYGTNVDAWCSRYVKELRSGQCDRSTGEVRYMTGFVYWMALEDFCLVRAVGGGKREEAIVLILAKYKNSLRPIPKELFLQLIKMGKSAEILRWLLRAGNFDEKMLGSVIHYALESSASPEVTAALLEASERIASEKEKSSSSTTDTSNTSSSSSYYSSSEDSSDDGKDDLRAAVQAGNLAVVERIVQEGEDFDETILADLAEAGETTMLPVILSFLKTNSVKVINTVLVGSLKGLQKDLIKDVLLEQAFSADFVDLMGRVAELGDTKAWTLFQELFPIRCNVLYKTGLKGAFEAAITGGHDDLVRTMAETESALNLAFALPAACSVKDGKYLDLLLSHCNWLSSAYIEEAFKAAVASNQIDHARLLLEHKCAYYTAELGAALQTAWEAGQRKVAVRLLDHEKIKAGLVDPQLDWLQKAVAKKDSGLVRRLVGCPLVDLTKDRGAGAKLLVSNGYGRAYRSRLILDSTPDPKLYRETLTEAIKAGHLPSFESLLRLCCHPRFEYAQRMAVYSQALTDLCRHQPQPKAMYLVTSMFLREYWLMKVGVPVPEAWKMDEADRYKAITDLMDIFLTFRLIHGHARNLALMSPEQKDQLSETQWIKLSVYSIADLRYVIIGKLIDLFIIENAKHTISFG